MDHLRPVESRMVALRDSGVETAEIASRFRKSPEFVERVLFLTEIPRRRRSSGDRDLRPIERRILDMRAAGMEHDEIARRFRRSPRSVRQIEGLAMYREGMRLLQESADHHRRS
jgi:DNA-binding CsgD family transcriptional regulator